MGLPGTYYVEIDERDNGEYAVIRGPSSDAKSQLLAQSVM